MTESAVVLELMTHMTKKSPFHSRPRLRPDEEEQIIDGIMEPNPVQALVPVDEADKEPPPDDKSRRPRRRLRIGFPRVDQPGAFVLAVTLIVGGTFFTLMNVSSLSEQVLEWWPLTVLGGALLWSFVALIRQDPRSFLAGTGALGFGISLLLAAQDIATFEETVVGAILITLGLGIVMRGLLLRSASPAGH